MNIIHHCALWQDGSPGVRGGRSAEGESDGIVSFGRVPARIALMNAAILGIRLLPGAVTVTIFRAVRSRSIVKSGENSKRFFIVFTTPYKLNGYATRLAPLELYFCRI
jgi:hypothetical protein